MGGAFSGQYQQEEEEGDHDDSIIISSSSGLGDLPENCIALILSHLDHPAEICKFARLNRAFHRASSSDLVWEPWLPENHLLLANKLIPDHHHHSLLIKKHIYSRLCRPCRFSGDDTMEAWVDKSKAGGICVAISWKGLKITGIHDRRCWTHFSTLESRFQTVAYLRQIWWLEVEGQLGFEFPKGTYSLFFRLKLGGRNPKRTAVVGHRQRTISSAEKVHGWDIKPVQFQVSSSNGQCVTSLCFLQDQGNWIHHHVGDFVVEHSGDPTKLKFSMAQIDCTHTKGGLCLDSVLIFPSNDPTKQLII